MIMTEFRRRQNSDRWHWSKECSNYPTEQDETQYSTIVVGRQGLSRSEEFLFGSISSKIVNHASNCTVWVVE